MSRIIQKMPPASYIFLENSGGYDNIEVIRLLDDIIDIYLPDFKFQDGVWAAKYCL